MKYVEVDRIYDDVCTSIRLTKKTHFYICVYVYVCVNTSLDEKDGKGNEDERHS